MNARIRATGEWGRIVGSEQRLIPKPISEWTEMDLFDMKASVRYNVLLSSPSADGNVEVWYRHDEIEVFP